MDQNNLNPSSGDDDPFGAITPLELDGDDFNLDIPADDLDRILMGDDAPLARDASFQLDDADIQNLLQGTADADSGNTTATAGTANTMNHNRVAAFQQSQQQQHQQRGQTHQMPTSSYADHLAHMPFTEIDEGLLQRAMPTKTSDTQGIAPGGGGAFDRMISQAVGSAATSTSTAQQQQPLDYEAEKQNLLMRLNQLNLKQQHQNQAVQQQQNLQQQQQQLQMRLQQQQQQVPAPVVASITSGTGGESALQSFLRNKGGKGRGRSTSPKPGASTSTSLLNQRLVGVPQASSIFSQQGSASMFNNNKSNSAVSASLRNQLRLDTTGVAVGGGGQSSNASWGGLQPSSHTSQHDGTSGFRTSGILPKHASDNHLLRMHSKRSGGTHGLARSRSRQGNISKESALYNLMRKSSSKNLIMTSGNNNDGGGGLSIGKRRNAQFGMAKQRISQSVPHGMGAMHSRRSQIRLQQLQEHTSSSGGGDNSFDPTTTATTTTLGGGGGSRNAMW